MRWMVLLLLAGCPGPSARQLWIAQDGGESGLKLTDSEPDPF
jgi:hypothetical protein